MTRSVQVAFGAILEQVLLDTVIEAGSPLNEEIVRLEVPVFLNVSVVMELLYCETFPNVRLPDCKEAILCLTVPCREAFFVISELATVKSPIKSVYVAGCHFTPKLQLCPALKLVPHSLLTKVVDTGADTTTLLTSRLPVFVKE